MSKTVLGVTTGFLYDGSNPVQELSGTTPTANLLTGSLDECFTRTDSSGTRDFLTDALGSTLALTDSAGTAQTSYTFEPFGSTAVAGSATTNGLAYTGRELDANGLYFYRARYYNAQLQRFIAEDPIGFGGGINLYRYVSDDPIDFWDPFGLKDYSEQETLDWLKRAYNDATAGRIQGLRNINRHSYKRSPLGDTTTEDGDFDFQNTEIQD